VERRRRFENNMGRLTLFAVSVAPMPHEVVIIFRREHGASNERTP